MAQLKAGTKAVFDALLAGFLLRGAERRARAFSPELERSLRTLRKAGRYRLEAASGLADPDFDAPALVLICDGLRLLARAALHQRGEAPGRSFREDVRKLAGSCPGAPANTEEVLEALSPPDSLAWDELPRQARRALVEDATALSSWVEGLVETRFLKEVRRARVLRIAALDAVVAVVLIVGVSKALRPTNLALHKPVKVSGSYAPSSAAPDGSGVVNGVIEATYGVHTQVNERAWVTIDLQRTFALDEVRVHNRGETRFQDEGLPLLLELSKDGQSFTLAARRDEHFSDSRPWKAALAGKVARFIRIANEKPAYLALTEIEAYGKPSP